MSRGLIRYPSRMRMFHRTSWALAISIVLISWAPSAHAQATGGDSEYSMYLGTMLPNQIEGVTEIMPVFGGRYGFRNTSVVVTEFGLSNIHAEGVDFTTFSASLRADLPDYDQFFGMVYAGVDLNYYRPIRKTERKFDPGFHAGAGLMMHVGGTLWLRSDLKFMAEPGTSLQILFGLVLRGN